MAIILSILCNKRQSIVSAMSKQLFSTYLVIITTLELVRVYKKSSSFNEYIHDLRQPDIVSALYDSVAKTFLAITVGYAIVFYIISMVNLPDRTETTKKGLHSNIVDFSFNVIGLPNWKMPTENESKLSKERNSTIKSEIDKALNKKLLICEYPNNAVRFFWYNATLKAGQIAKPFGVDYRKSWIDHPLQRIEGNSSVCPPDGNILY
jgi:hypothetical protein